MAENPEPLINGLDAEPEIKSEPLDDPLIETTDHPVIPKEFLNGTHGEDSDCEDVSFFTQVEVDNTRKCLENTRLIIKDFETQLDWHLQQYMTLRNVFGKKGKNKDDKRQDLLSISQLSAIIANHPEGNKKFIKRKGTLSNGSGGRKRRKGKDSESEEEEEEDTDFSEDSEEYDEDFDESDSEGVDDPSEGKAKAKKTRGKKKGMDTPQVKDEIEEEFHDLIEPKEEIESDDDMMEQTISPKKSPAKRGRKKQSEVKTPPKRGRGKKGKMETVDLTSMKNCSVVLNRVDDEDDDFDVKDEELDRDELIEMLQDQAIESLDKFYIDKDKPISILKDGNYKEFDYNECKTGNVVVLFEDKESFPEFIFMKNIADLVLDGSVLLVQKNVFDQHLTNEDK